MVLNKEQRQRAKEQTAALAATYNLHFLHIRKSIFTGDFDERVLLNKGGMTLAYSKAHPQDSIILVSTALVNDQDSYCKAHGRAIAARRFADAHCVALRVPKNMSASYFLKSVFGPAVSM